MDKNEFPKKYLIEAHLYAKLNLVERECDTKKYAVTNGVSNFHQHILFTWLGMATKKNAIKFFSDTIKI